MPLIVAREQLKPEQTVRTRLGTKTTFFSASRDHPDGPTAFIGQYNPGGKFSAHFHTVDQFQIIIDGEGRFGRHDVGMYFVHFARAFTPYGPLSADKGWSFLSLCSHYDAGGQDLATSYDKLKQMPDRDPWQASEIVTFEEQPKGASVQEVQPFKDDRGLSVQSLNMAPNSRSTTTDPALGDGLFVAVLKGGLMAESKLHPALTVVYLTPDERAFDIHAGPEGLQGLVLNLPKTAATARTSIGPNVHSTAHS